MTRLLFWNMSSATWMLRLLESAIAYMIFTAVLRGPGPSVPAANGWMRPDADALGLTIVMALFNVVLGTYRPGARFRSVAAGAIAVPLGLAVAAAAWIAPEQPWAKDPLGPLAVGVVGASILVVARCAYAAAVSTGLMTRRVIVVGQDAEASRLMAAIAAAPSGLFRPERAESFDQARRMVERLGSRNAWGIVAAGVAEEGGVSSSRPGYEGLGLRIVPAATFWERELGRVDTLTGIEPGRSAGRAEDWRPSRLRRIGHRALDLAVASTLLLLACPLMAVIALAIRLESPGPVIYRQQRLGLNGVPFTLYKLRSMRRDAETGRAVWAKARDPRVTRVGRLIRRSRIDELPQLINVVKGTMSMVGPRPERPCLAAEIALVEPGFARRTRVKPGLTGWAQVNYPYCASAEDAAVKLSFDLWYDKHRSVSLDLLILCMTVRVVLFQEGSR